MIFIHAKSAYRFAEIDCNLAYKNASLMAESMGISKFYAGFVLSAYKLDKTNKLNKILKTDNKVCAIMVLGISKYKFSKYPDKKPLVFNEIR